MPVRPRFNPASIPPFTVIRCRFEFSGDPQSELRRFVLLSHADQHAMCMKATSKLDAYRNRPDRMPGVIFVRAGTVGCFNRDTIIQPDNHVLIPHSRLATQHANGDLEILGSMYDGFAADLVKAVRNSKTMDLRKQKRILGILGF